MAVWSGKVLTSSDLFRYIFTPNGVLTNVFSITYEIALASVPGTLITGPTAATNFATGKYYAAWTVPDGQDAGSYIITWKWKFLTGSDLQTEAITFAIVAPTTSSGIIAPAIAPYITVDEFKENIVYIEGELPTDAEIEAKIAFAQEYIEKLTGQFFNSRELTVNVNGNGLYTLRLDYPIVSLSNVEYSIDNNVNHTEYDLTTLYVYNNLSDDRDYPKIQNVGNVFPSGFGNIRITGTFGYLTPELTTPEPIKKVVMMIVNEWLTDIQTTKGNLRQGKTFWDKTNGRETHIVDNISYGKLTGDPEIDNILGLYTKVPYVTIV